MAVTKIKPIRGTVNKALAYILDPRKTDDAFYVSSYGCAASDAAAKEFEWTRNLAVQQGMQMPKVLARHLIQSFDIGEVTPEEAHEVGKQLADEWLKGKYEYVIAISCKEIAMQALKTACTFYGGDWAGTLEVDLDFDV